MEFAHVFVCESEIWSSFGVTFRQFLVVSAVCLGIFFSSFHHESLLSEINPTNPPNKKNDEVTELFQCAVIKSCLFQKSVHPTTGILAVFVALNYCDVVHIAGFGYPNSKSQRQPIHYYGYDTMKSMKVGSSHL